IVDVSRHAAQLLAFYGKGTAKGRVTYRARADGPGGAPVDSTTATAVAAAPTGAVQVASLDPVAAAPATTPAPAPQPVLQDPPPPDVPSPSPEKLDAKLEAKADTPPVVTTVPVPAATHLYVQVGAFSIKENAERLKNRLSTAGNLTISSIDRKAHTPYRARVSPFDDVSTAGCARAHINGLGSRA